MGYTRKKKIVIINNEKKKQQQNVVLGSHHSLTHILWKHQKATKKKKKFKCEVSAYANLTYCIILVIAATKLPDSDFSLCLF